MPLDASKKLEIIGKFRRESGDTGSPEVQIALLTYQIESVTTHLAKHIKDNHTRRGLIKMVSKRRRLLDYLKTKSPTRLEKIKKSLHVSH